jgi:hypothetical protein
VTEPLLTIEIVGEQFLFMADTGAMVSIVQPAISKAQVRECEVQAHRYKIRVSSTLNSRNTDKVRSIGHLRVGQRGSPRLIVSGASPRVSLPGGGLYMALYGFRH